MCRETTILLSNVERTGSRHATCPTTIELESSNTPNTHSRSMQLDQPFFHRLLATPIPFDNRRFERQGSAAVARPRHFTGLGVQPGPSHPVHVHVAQKAANEEGSSHFSMDCKLIAHRAEAGDLRFMAAWGARS